jgi:sulfate adenylyltransferase large subunit
MLDLLRFTTAGSVDDGKSTLIGRLLYDSKQVFEDQLDHVRDASQRRNGDGALDLSLLTDGLRAEREQGITIDVAYRYFATPQRRFIIADVPGHQQYTRNMVTGASTADLSIVLLDARKGLIEQSRRHTFISSLLRIPHLVVCVNKMDLVDYDQEPFEAARAAVEDFASGLDVADLTFIPISALHGDNVVEASERMPWYDGPPLLHHLERVEVSHDHPDSEQARLPVQWVIRPGADTEHGDYRAYAGQLASGALRPGDDVVVLPAGLRTRIAAIDVHGGQLEEALAPQSVAVRLEDELDVSRGDVICRASDPPEVGRRLSAELCWMSDRPLTAGARYALKHTTRVAQAVIEELEHRIDVHTLAPEREVSELALNDIGRITLRTSTPLAFDPYAANRATGSFILIDEASNDTVGAGMIVGSAD